MSMGTHDLDKIKGKNITYTALPRKEVVFRALKQEKEMNAAELFESFEKNDPLKLKKYVELLDGSDLVPVFLDEDNKVLSLPPIINSEVTKITIDTKNIFIDMTGLDYHKLCICMNVLAG